MTLPGYDRGMRRIALTLCALAATAAACGSFAVAATTPSQKQLDAYTTFQEWHFELRLTAAEKAKYQGLLRQDVVAGGLVEDVGSAPSTVTKLASSGWLELSRFHAQQRQVDAIDRSTTEMLNNGTISGKGIWAGTMREAQSGLRSSAYLLDLLAAAEKPIAGTGNVTDSLFPRHVDALFDWTAYRYAKVTGSTRGLDTRETARAAFRRSLAASWTKALPDAKKLGELRAQVQAALGEWLVWRLAGYTPYARLSPFQQRAILAQWGAEIVPAMPSVAAAARRRVAELKSYVAKMPAAEARAEYRRKLAADRAFDAAIAQMQGEANALSATVTQMRQSMVDFHVANLNIAENTGSSGYVWRFPARP